MPPSVALAQEKCPVILVKTALPETERLIQEALFRMARRRTTIVVAHRLSTIRKANRILVMHKGRIREQGTHEELMTLKGIYYKLNQLQMEADS